MDLRKRISLTAAAQCFLIAYYLMFVSISTDYWTQDGKNHEGLWTKCIYNSNMSMSYGNDITCCSSIPFEGHIGAAGFFFIVQLIVDTISIICWFHYFPSNETNSDHSMFGVYINSFISFVLMVIVLSAYGGKDGDSKILGWSFHLLLGVFLCRFPFYIFLCVAAK